MGNPFASGTAGYAASRPDYPPALAQFLADIAPDRAHAVDVGCGSGQLASKLAAHFERVTAIDSSRSQLRQAPPDPRITYSCRAADDSGVAAGTASLIAAAQAAHWFALEPFYAEVRRIARDGAVLALLTYDTPSLPGEAGARFARFYHDGIGAFWDEARRLVETGYATLPFPFKERRLPPFTIERAWTFAELAAYVETWSATRKARSRGFGDTVDAGLLAICQAWSEPGGTLPVAWRLGGRIGVVRAGRSGA